MSKIDGYKFISADPQILHGAARIEGTRIAVWMIAQDIQNGSTLDSIKTAYSLDDDVMSEVLKFIRQHHPER